MENLALLSNVKLLEEVEYLAYQPVRQYHVKMNDPFELSDNKFVKLFRINKPMADELLDKLYPFLRCGNTMSALDPEVKFFAALRFFASGSYQTDIGESRYIGICQASTSRAIHEVVDAVQNSGLFSETIQFPNTIEKIAYNRMQFYKLYNFPGCVGCIDCTHVAIFPPPKNDPVFPEHIYVNRKGYHSINTQLICNADKEIINVNARYPGSTSDIYIWDNSNVKAVMTELHSRFPCQSFLLGDSGYSNRPWLLIPIPETVEGSPEERYNKRHRSTRTIIEQVNAILKFRWRCTLKHRVLHYRPDFASKIINTCCTLHNLCIKNKLADVPPEDPDLDDPLDGLNVNDDVYEDHEEMEAVSRVNPFLAEARRFQRQLVRQFFN